MLETLYYFLHYRADFILAALLVAGACWWAMHIIRRRGRQHRVPFIAFLVAAGLMLVGGLFAELMARQRINQLVNLFAGFGPMYASELANNGHAGITARTAPDDPAYLKMIEDEKRWLTANPVVSDIYTFRKDAEGKIHLIVDSETDYDHNGKINGDREQRTVIGEIYEEATPQFYQALAGQKVFDSSFVPDRWGVSVSSFTPIYDRNGQVEAAVGVDYPANAWLYAIGSVRAATLALTLGLIGILLVSSTLISFLTLEIEERKEFQRRLEQATESAVNASAGKSEFLARMSHEVRNPLTAILGFARFLSETELNATQRRYVDTIDRAGGNLLHLLNDILDYTKVESGKLELERIAWAPAMLVHEVIELMAVRAKEKELTLTFDNRLPGTLTLFGDPTRMRQILINLLSNALKFTSSGGVTVTASWSGDSLNPNRGQLALDVTDTGMGIPADRLPRLFQAFTQADSSTTRNHGGTGLGLAICKRLADMMGATISVSSTPKVGTTFTFVLNSDAAVAYGPDYPTTAGTAPPLSVWTRALVVDDVALNAQLLKVQLRRLGLEADIAASGRDALEFAKANPYAIIFIDLRMPDMDGFQTAQRIRDQEAPGRHVPIIAISGQTISGIREKCLAAGMDDYMAKPVYLPALKSTLEALVPRFKVAQAETQAPFPIAS